MKVLEFRPNQDNKKSVIIKVGIIVFVILLILLISLYIANQNVRAFLDRYVFRKEILQDSTVSIQLKTEEDVSIYAYDKYITVLSKNKLSCYTNSGNIACELEVTVNKPVYSANNRFLCIGEEKGKKVYLVSGENILWQKEIEGEIVKVNVNKNGYVSIILSGTSYKSIIITLSPEGKELFKTYLSSTMTVATDISNDNKYLAIAEANTSGTVIQSNIKVISMEKAASDPSNSVINTYSGENNQLVINIKYQEKGSLVCLYDDSIHVIEKEEDSKLLDINEKATHYDINLKNNIVQVIEKSTGLFNTDTEVLITNIYYKAENIYKLSSSAKAIYAYGDVIAINIGSEVHFVSTNGWLLKKYVSSQEVDNIVLGDSIGGIIYSDKIEIIGL